MASLRPFLLLALFFVGLYILRDPVQKTGPNLQVILVQPIKDFLANLKFATTTVSDYSALPTYVSKGNIEPAQAPYGNSNGSTSWSTSTSGNINGNTSTKSYSTTSSATKTTTRSPEAVLETDKKNVNSLPPIKSTQVDTSEALTIDGIISFTNVERLKAGLPALKKSDKLIASSAAKMDDMFKNQYFEHVSPSGIGVSDLAGKAGYEYIIIGENLALGNFGGDAKVVAAWIASPGHKANILNTKYQEIGVAVAQRTFEGRKQWIAVQHFGTPLSICPALDTNEKISIDSSEKALSVQETVLLGLKTAIDQKTGDEYKQKVSEYNVLVEGYNQSLATLKVRISKYNNSVKTFNSCVGL